MRRLLKSEAGQSVVLIALVLIVLMIFAAIAIDIGMVAIQKGKLQTALDAAALAAAQELPDTTKATAMANSYMQKNGFLTSDIEQISYSNGNKRVTLAAKKSVPYSFASVLGVSATTIETTAAAEKGTTTNYVPFQYAVFSGEKGRMLTLRFLIATINGSVYANGPVDISAAGMTINGNLESTGRITVGGLTNNINGTCQGSEIYNVGLWNSFDKVLRSPANELPMPDFSHIVEQSAAAAGKKYTGDKSYLGNVNVNSSIYVDGNLNVNECLFNGKGSMLATGDIVFNGLVTRVGDSSVCFYSRDGDITINSGCSELNGLIYAPNGTVIFNGGGQKINGRVVAKCIRFSETGIKINPTSVDLQSLPSDEVKLVE